MTEQPRRSESCKRRNAFTLVEMIVVIGIISVLISLLLPALQRAKQQANQVVCSSNMRQIGTEMLMYANDNNGYLFPPNLGWPAQPIPPATPDPGIVNGLDPGPALIGDPGNPPICTPSESATAGWDYTSWPKTPNQNLAVWPYYVFNPHIWNPAFMICPSDIDPSGQHSYLANAHLEPISMASKSNAAPNATADIRYSTTLPPGHTPSDVIVLGEKISSVYDYYMDPGEFNTKVEQYRHGLNVGSNYLFLDMHVEPMVPGNNQQVMNALDPWDVTPPP